MITTVPSDKAPSNPFRGIEDERWRAHTDLHSAAGLVATKAAQDVKEALDRAAIEVTGRLTEVRSYIDQVLTSHGDLHAADHEALILARDGITRQLHEINTLREQMATERALFVSGDVVRTLISAERRELAGSTTAMTAEIKAMFTRELDASRLVHLELAARLSALETRFANLDGRLIAAGTLTIVGIGVIEFVLRGLG